MSASTATGAPSPSRRRTNGNRSKVSSTSCTRSLKGCSLSAGPGQGLGITIETDELEPGLRPEQSLGVSSETDRRIDQQTWAGRRKQLHHPIGEHRQVFGGHSRPPSQLQLREFLELLIAQRRFLEE